MKVWISYVDGRYEAIDYSQITTAGRTVDIFEISPELWDSYLEHQKIDNIWQNRFAMIRGEWP
jgi:hypothetical protein